MLTTSGTIADVAAFFCVSVRTLAEWKSSRPPLLTAFQVGRNVSFGEETVIDLRVRKSTTANGVTLLEAREIARREWRELLKVRRADSRGQRLATVEARPKQLEAKPVLPATNLAARPWMSGAEVAVELGFSPGMVRARAADLGGYRLGRVLRFRRECVLAFRGNDGALRKPISTLQNLATDVRTSSDLTRDRDNRVMAELMKLSVRIEALEKMCNRKVV